MANIANVAIEIKDLVKTYGTKNAVDGLSLDINEGELFALLGVNGAGKTTTIKMLSCLTKPTSGDAIILGNSIISHPQGVKEILNVSPQETAIAPNLTVLENVVFMAGVYGIGGSAATEKATQLIDDLGLREVIKSKAKTLSGGMQRRLSIAMALITDPKILFLDEPTLGLDVLARRELWHAIVALKGKVTVILTTHYMEEAEELSDRIGIMARGKLLAVGTASELIARANGKNFEDAFVKIATGTESLGSGLDKAPADANTAAEKEI